MAVVARGGEGGKPGASGLPARLGAVALLSLLALVPGALAAWETPPEDVGEVLATWPGSSPATDGAAVAFVAPDGSLRVRDPWTGAERTLREAGPTPLEELRLAGGRLAFVAAGSARELFEGPLDGPHTSVRGAPGQSAPALGADGALAWLDDADGTLDVWLRAPGGEPRAVTDDAAGQQQPSLSTRYVAWSDTRNTSPLPILLPRPPAARAHPSNLDVYVLDRATGVVFQGTDEAFEQVQPVLAGDRLAYLSPDAHAYGLYARTAGTALAGGRSALLAEDLRPFRLAAAGDRVLALEGLNHAARLMVVDDAGVRPVPGDLESPTTLSAGGGLAAVELVRSGGTREVAAIRLPSALRATVAADGEGCWRVRATGGTADRALQELDGSVRELAAASDGDGFTACGGGLARVVGRDGASPAVALAAETEPEGAPAFPAAGAAVALVAAAAQRRRRAAARATAASAASAAAGAGESREA